LIAFRIVLAIFVLLSNVISVFPVFRRYQASDESDVQLNARRAKRVRGH